MIFSPVFLAFYDKKDADFVNSGEELLAMLEKAEPESDNAEYWKNAFLREMFNHESGITWQADFDVCSCFGNCSSVSDIDDINALFAACNFSDVQRDAYMAARREYSKQSAELY